MPVIDCHGHLGSWPQMCMPKCTVEDTLQTMDRLGVDRLCVSSLLGCLCDFRSGNDEVGEAVRRYPHRLIGMTVVNPNYPDELVAELQRCESLYGMAIAKIHPFCHEYPADGENYREFWRYAEDQEMIVLTHTWDADRTCGPEMFGPIAREYPHVKIILAHAGVTQSGCEQAIRVAGKHENLFIDTASSQPHTGMIERFVHELGAERVLFGSDTPMLEPSAPLGRIAYSDISETDKKRILGLNMLELLNENAKTVCKKDREAVSF